MTPEQRKKQHAEDLANLQAVQDSGSLSDFENARFEDIFADFAAHSIIDPDYLLTSKQRSMLEDAVRTLGLRQPTYASGSIPQGKPVALLFDPSKRPLKPPSKR